MRDPRRVRFLEALEERVRQFRPREDLWPFRVPHEPIAFEDVAPEAPGVRPDAVRTRAILQFEWDDSRWDAWAITLSSGIHVYCDSDDRESRVLASAKRGNPIEADGFFLERLAESRGHGFGIELEGPPPNRVRSSLSDRGFLADVIVELYEGTPGQQAIANATATPQPADDFRADVERWLAGTLVAPPPSSRSRLRRLRDVLDDADWP